MAVQRNKEIGIRKVLGASVGQVVFLLSKEFTLLVLVAFALATPLSWYFMHQWLQQYVYRIDLGAGLFYRDRAGGGGYCVADRGLSGVAGGAGQPGREFEVGVGSGTLRTLFQILVIKTDGRGDDGIGGGEHRDEVQSIEDHAIADGQAFVLADIRRAGGWRHLVTAAAIVQHGKSIVITFHKDADNGGDPADDGDERKDQQANQIDGLPQRVA
jgi:hypothetical protein